MTDRARLRRDLFRTHLQTAVALRIIELRDADDNQIRHQALAYQATDLWHDTGGIAVGDGDSGTVNRLVRTLAALAYADGGVTFDGLHWCTDHAHCLAVRGVA